MNYTLRNRIPNAMIRDPNLSWKAKGLYLYIASKKEDYDFSIHRITQESKDGRDSTLQAIYELEKAGYLRRQKLKTGRTLYELLPSAENPNKANPDTENPNKGQKPDPENPTYGNSHVGKIRTISITENQSITDKKEITDKTPIVPLRGQDGGIPIIEPKYRKKSQTEKKQLRVNRNTELMIRIGKWLKRKESTLWSIYEFEALERIGEISDDAIEALEQYYCSEPIDPNRDYRRRNVETLLNNWNGELDRANQSNSLRQGGYSHAGRGDENYNLIGVNLI